MQDINANTRQIRVVIPLGAHLTLEMKEYDLVIDHGEILRP
jgi:hypothetical protein